MPCVSLFLRALLFLFSWNCLIPHSFWEWCSIAPELQFLGGSMSRQRSERYLIAYRYCWKRVCRPTLYRFVSRLFTEWQALLGSQEIDPWEHISRTVSTNFSKKCHSYTTAPQSTIWCLLSSNNDFIVLFQLFTPNADRALSFSVLCMSFCTLLVVLLAGRKFVYCVFKLCREDAEAGGLERIALQGRALLTPDFDQKPAKFCNCGLRPCKSSKNAK